EYLVFRANRIDLVDVPVDAHAVHRLLVVALGAAGDTAFTGHVRGELAFDAGEQVAHARVGFELVVEGQDAHRGHQRASHVEPQLQRGGHRALAIVGNIQVG